MPLSPGSRIGHYEIVAAIGAGGMGEVYRATDTHLKRQVAIKILPATVASDADRLARFQREAEVLAALNHPNIAQIYGLERRVGQDGQVESVALVMEFVDGEDLATRISRGAIPLDEVLPIAKQIVEALEAAHDHAIIHRDLKPANIKVREDGTVKVLDFGLAKAIEPAATAMASGLSMSPTLTSPAMTSAGMILGTAAYMAPEQAKGKAVDRRADIWAFGAVLYEMVTGKQAFTGDSVTEVLASVLAREPDWSKLPANASMISGVIRRCLERDPRQRFGDMQSVRLALGGALLTSAVLAAVPEPAAASAAPSRRSKAPRSTIDRWAWRLTILAAIAAIVLGRTYLMRPGSPQVARAPVRLNVDFPSDADLTSDPALSPDGRQLVYGMRQKNVQQLYRRPLDQFTASPIADTENADGPFFSPDGQWIGFFVGGEMKKIPVSGGEPITITKAGGSRASWGADGSIVFSTSTFGSTIKRVSAAGGEASVLTKLDTSQGEVAHQASSMLPAGRGVLFDTLPAGKIFMRPLPDGTPKELIEGQFPLYISTGHIVFTRDSSLWAVPFNVDRLEITGPPVRLAEGVQSAPVVSNDGTLVYVSGTPSTVQLVWVTRQGREEPAELDAGDFKDVALSPDGKRVVFNRGSIQDRGSIQVNFEMWIGDLAKRTATKLPTGSVNTFPLWTPDGLSVVYSSTMGGGRNIFRSTADGAGSPERLTKSANQQSPWTWTKDGKTLVLNELRTGAGGTGGYHLVSVPANGGDASNVVEELGSDRTPAISPDGRWIAYQAQGDGAAPQIVVRPFPNATAHRWQVSTVGGFEPKWSHDSRELFYRWGNSVMKVAIGDDPGASRPEKLFDGSYVLNNGSKTWDVAPDGRFLMQKPNRAQLSISVVLHWTEDLKRLVPAK